MPRRNLSAIAIVGLLSVLCWRPSAGAKPRDEMMELYGTFVDAVEQVEANYVRKVDRRELLESALRGMLEDLDPHSAYFNESDFKRFEKEIKRSFPGIGVQVEIDPETNRLKILAPLVGSPAFKAGVHSGDLVLEVDGDSTEGWNLDKAMEALQGRPGTEVKLGVLHAGADKLETIAIQRAIIDLPSVLGAARKPDGTWNYLLDEDRKIGYIRLDSFTEETPEEVKSALEELKRAGMKGLLLDLRDDPGGLLAAAVEVSDLFIEEGKIVSTRGRNTREKVYRATKEGTYTGFPIAVLVNRHSASASEILAACLQDHKRAKVVGERSYGKGSVQSLLQLDGGESVLKLTVATYWRPSGKNIHKFKNAKAGDEWGVTPDPGLAVRFSEEDYRDWYEERHDHDLLTGAEKKEEKPAGEDKGKAEKPFVDRQLEKALEAVRTELDETKAKKAARAPVARPRRAG